MDSVVVPKIEYLEDVFVQLLVIWPGKEVYPSDEILKIYYIVFFILIIRRKEKIEDPICPNAL